MTRSEQHIEVIQGQVDFLENMDLIKTSSKEILGSNLGYSCIKSIRVYIFQVWNISYAYIIYA